MSRKDLPPLPPPSDPVGRIRRRFGVASTDHEPDLLSFPPSRPEGRETATSVAALKEWRGRPRQASRSRDPTVETLGVLVPPIRLPEELSGYRPQDVGLLTHALIAVLAPLLPSLTDVTLAERIHDVAASLVGGSNVNRRRVLQATACGHAATYLRRLTPPQPWRLLGCEFKSGSGRVDVAWTRPRGVIRVFYDEIKTVNRPIRVVQPGWVEQAQRYAEAGQRDHGPRFGGVRLLPLGSLHVAALIRAGQPIASLDLTNGDPLAVVS